MSRIELNVVATGNFKSLESSIARLRTQVNSINSSFANMSMDSRFLNQINSYSKAFEDTIDASGMFQRHMVSISSETQRFGRNLETGSLRINQLFRAASEYRRGELGQIRQLAREQVRFSNSTLFRTPDGKSQLIVPRGIDEFTEKQKILNNEFRIFREVVRNGSTEIINWGKNTQWAGRQLTVGLTVPITLFGAAASKMFMDADKQLTRLAKVYGDASKGMVDPSELESIRKETLSLAQEIASTMGVAVGETLGIAADIAATGKEGNELLEATNEAMRLSVLGEVDRQEAMRATISIQNVFKKDTQGLAESINFLNAVENQTSTNLQDLVTGVVKAGPVVQGLGGDIKDLSLMMVAMREGGISAAEAANAIKSSLASLINPTKQTQDLMNGFGIDLVGIVDKNAGNVIGTLIDLQNELSNLDELSKQRAIEQIFGKFQFSRINALLANIGRAGSQTQQVIELAGMSTSELAKNAEMELSAVTESATGKFQRAMETIKASLIPIGEVFLTAGTLILNIGNKILEVFNALPDPVKLVINGLLGLTAIAGPIIMITGVLGNFFGYIVRGISSLMLLKKAGRGALATFSPETTAAEKSAEAFTKSIYDQTSAMNTMSSAVERLVVKMEDLVNSMRNAGNAGTNLDNVLANAEARAVGEGTYVSPSAPFEKRSGGGGLKRTGITYSHLTADSIIKAMLPSAYKSMSDKVMGVGTFVSGQASSDLNALLKDFVPNMAAVSESTVTDQSRREMLRAIAEQQITSPSHLVEAQKIIDQMSSEELAQFLPSWEKISAQTSEYVGTLQAAAASLETNTKETKALLETFKTESLLDPSGALKNLQDGLTKLDVNVKSHIDQVAAEFSQIRTEVLALPENQQGRAAVDAIIQRVTVAREAPALDAISGQVKGFSKGGYQEVLLFAAQQYADELANSGLVSKELAAALKRTINAEDNYQKALAEAAAATKASTQSEKELDAAKDNLKSIMDRMRLKNDQFVKNADGDWLYKEGGGKVVAKDLIDALNRRKAAEDAAAEAATRVAQTSETVIDSEDRLRETNSQLEYQREVETRASQESTTAEKQDTDATRRSAITEEIDARSSTDLALAEQQDAAATRGSSAAKGGYGRAGTAMKFMGGLSAAAGIATMLAPTGENQALGAATNILGGAAMGAGMGSMIAPVWGTIIGGIVGAAIPALTEYMGAIERAIQESKDAVEEITLSYASLTAQEQGVLGKEISSMADLTFNSLNKKTDEATTAVESFAEAIKEAEKGTVEYSRAQQFRNAQTSDDIINSPAFRTIIGTALATNADSSGAKAVLEAYLRATDSQAYAAEVFAAAERSMADGLGMFINSERNRVEETKKMFEEGFGGKWNFDFTPVQDVYIEALSPLDAAKQFSKAAQDFDATVQKGIKIGDTEIKSLADAFLDKNFISELSQAARGGESSITIGGEMMTAEAANQILSSMGSLIVTNADGLQMLRPGILTNIELLQTFREEASLVGDVLSSAFATLPLDEFEDTVLQTVVTLENSVDAVGNSLAMTSEEVDQFRSSLPVNGQEVFDRIYESTNSTAAAMAAARLAVADVGYELQELIGMSGEEILVVIRQVVVTERINQGLDLVTDSAEFTGKTLEQRNAAAGGSSGSSGGGADTSGLDKQIEAQQKIIDKIKEERDERQKLADLQQQSIDFALKQQDLENQIARARAEGDFAQVALLQAQLDAEKGKERTAEVERKRQEKEDDRIKKAEDEIKRLEDLKKEMTSGGGGGGGSAADTAKEVKYLTRNAIDGVLEEAAREGIFLSPEEFINTKQVQKMMKQLVDGYGATVTEAESYAMQFYNAGNQSLLSAFTDLDAMHDKLVEELNLYKGFTDLPEEERAKITANLEFIMMNPMLDRTEKIKRARQMFQDELSMGPRDSAEAAKESYAVFESLYGPEGTQKIVDGFKNTWRGIKDEFSKEEAKIITSNYIDGISEGLEDETVKKNIHDGLYNMFYGQLLDQKVPAQLAAAQAESMANATMTTLNTKMEGYEINVPITPVYEDTSQYNAPPPGVTTPQQTPAPYSPLGPLQDPTGAWPGTTPSPIQGPGIPQPQSPMSTPDPSWLNPPMSTPDPSWLNPPQAPDMTPVANDVVDGYSDGVSARASQVLPNTYIQSLLNTAKTALGISSPSKEFQSLGEMSVEGFKNGIHDTLDSVSVEFEQMIEDINELLKSGFEDTSTIVTPPIENISNTFYDIMTSGMQDTVDEINRILVNNLKDYTFDIIGDPKIYATSATMPIWSKVFSGLPSTIFTSELPQYATGGYISGPGGPTDDKILARLSDGEYVIKASSVEKYGTELLDQINNNKFATGGLVGYKIGGDVEGGGPRKPVYFGGTPTSSTGYSKPAPTYSGGTPTYYGGYTSTNTQATGGSGYTAQTLNIPNDGRGMITYNGANYAWDSAQGKYVKLADVRTGSAASGFGYMFQDIMASIEQQGVGSTAWQMISYLAENPQELLPFVGSNSIDTSTDRGKDMYAASSLLDILSVIPGLGFVKGISAIKGASKAGKSIRVVPNSQLVKSSTEVSDLPSIIERKTLSQDAVDIIDDLENGRGSSYQYLVDDARDILRDWAGDPGSSRTIVDQRVVDSSIAKEVRDQIISDWYHRTQEGLIDRSLPENVTVWRSSNDAANTKPVVSATLRDEPLPGIQGTQVKYTVPRNKILFDNQVILGQNDPSAVVAGTLTDLEREVLVRFEDLVPVTDVASSTPGTAGRIGVGLAATAPFLGAWSGGLEMLNFLGNPGALAALGIGAAAMSPLGRRILTMPYHAVRNRDILNNAVHISNRSIKELEHPALVDAAHGRANGPGMYFSDRRYTRASDMFRREADIFNQDTWYRPTVVGPQYTRLMLGWDRWGKAGSTSLVGRNALSQAAWGSRGVRKRKRNGIVGVHTPGYTTIFDMGVPGSGWDIRDIPTPKRANSLNNIWRATASVTSKAALLGIPPYLLWELMGRLVGFANGGLVRMNKDNQTILGEGISDYSRQFVGTPYSSSAEWADGPKNGWGCATATKWLYDSYAGVDLGHPSLSAAQYASSNGSVVNNMLPGDLLYFYYKNGVNTQNPINHTGMYLGNGSMFHARSEALGTQITGVDEPGMQRAAARAGGTAIKRYLPLTIAGMGLPVGNFANGGKIYGSGGPESDDILAMVSNGEYVMSAKSVRRYGKEFMDAVNLGVLPEAATGGMVTSKYPGIVQNMANGGLLSRKYGVENPVSNSTNVEYNINVNVAGTNASPDEIANAVMKSMKRKERMTGAVTRV